MPAKRAELAKGTHREEELRRAQHGARGQGHTLLRARHPDNHQAEGGQRVPWDLEHRGPTRGGHRHGGDGVGHPREGASAASQRPRRRPQEPDLPLADGHEHLGQVVDTRAGDTGDGDPPRRGVQHLRPPDRLAGRAGRIQAHRPLRVHALPRDDIIPLGAQGEELRDAAEAQDNARRHQEGRGHPRRADHGPSLHLVVDGIGAQHRRGQEGRAAPERHDHAGRGGRRLGGAVGAREPEDGDPLPR